MHEAIFVGPIACYMKMNVYANLSKRVYYIRTYAYSRIRVFAYSRSGQFSVLLFLCEIEKAVNTHFHDSRIIVIRVYGISHFCVYGLTGLHILVFAIFIEHTRMLLRKLVCTRLRIYGLAQKGNLLRNRYCM